MENILEHLGAIAATGSRVAKGCESSKLQVGFTFLRELLAAHSTSQKWETYLNPPMLILLSELYMIICSSSLQLSSII